MGQENKKHVEGHSAGTEYKEEGGLEEHPVRVHDGYSAGTLIAIQVSKSEGSRMVGIHNVVPTSMDTQVRSVGQEWCRTIEHVRVSWLLIKCTGHVQVCRTSAISLMTRLSGNCKQPMTSLSGIRG